MCGRILTLMKMLIFVWVAFVHIGCKGATPRAKVYFVDAMNGNDLSSGLSITSPWRTLERVNKQQFSNGDSLLFKSGTVYIGQLKPKANGTEGSPVVISSYGEGNKPFINGKGVMPATVWIYNTQYIEISNLIISNHGVARQPGLSGLKVQISNFGKANHILLSHLDIADVNGLLEKKLGGGSGILIENGGDSLISVYNDLKIEDCTIRRCERNGIIFEGYWSRKNWHPNTNVIIRNNNIEEVPGDGIVPIGCDGAQIEHNTMRNCTRLLPLGEAAAGIWPWSCDNTVIQFNEVSDHKAPWDGQGFDSDWNCQNTLIQYNYSHDNEGGFLLVCNDGGVGKGFSIGNTGTVVRYNVSLNDGNRKHKTHAGVFSPVIHFAGPANQTKILNNLIIHTGEVSDTLDNKFIHFSNWGGMPESTLFANNVFVSHTSTTIDLQNSPNIEFINNLFTGVFINLPQGNFIGNIEDTVIADKWKLQGGDLKGFELLVRFRNDSAFIGYDKGIVIKGNAMKDFFGKPTHNTLTNIGIDQQKILKLPQHD